MSAGLLDWVENGTWFWDMAIVTSVDVCLELKCQFLSKKNPFTLTRKVLMSAGMLPHYTDQRIFVLFRLDNWNANWKNNLTKCVQFCNFEGFQL